jgi:hypothetical protein
MRAVAVALRCPTAPLPAGWKAATANDAAKDRMTPRRRGSGVRRKSDSPVEVRQQLLDAIYDDQPFRTVVRDLGLTTNQVWGLGNTDKEWKTALEAALMAIRRDDLQHGTKAAYVRGCVCGECREHQRIRMTQNRKPLNAT